MNEADDVVTVDIIAKQKSCQCGGYCAINKEDNELRGRCYNELGDRHITLVRKLTRKVLRVSAGLLASNKVSRYHASDKERECRCAAEHDVSKVYSKYPARLGDDE